MEQTFQAEANILEKLSAEPKNWWKRLIVVLAVTVIVLWGASSMHFTGITEKGPGVAKNVIYGLTHPDLSLLFNLTEGGVPFLVLQTFAIAILGTIFGAILAIPVSFLSSSSIVPKWVSLIFRAIVLFIRTIPALIWAYIWIRVTGPGAFCGVMTQSICSIGMISKMYVTAIEDLDRGVLEALDACGCSMFEKIRVGILPQLSASFVSTAIYRFDINLKDATTLGIVGAGGIGAPMLGYAKTAKYTRVGSFLWALIIVVVVIEWISTRIRARLAHGRR